MLNSPLTDQDKKEAASFFASVRIFEDLTQEELYLLASFFSKEERPNPGRIIHEGEISQDFFIIKSGFVSIVRGTDKKGAFISNLGPGDYFGEASLFHNIKRIANVDHQNSVTLLKIQKSDFEKFLNLHPITANRILKQMLKQLFLRLERTTHELQFERRQALAQEAIDQMFS